MQLSLNWITDKYASKTPQPNELKLGRNHLWKVLYKDCSFCPISINKHGHHRRFLYLIGLFLKIFSSETALPNDPKLGRKKSSNKDCSFCPNLLTSMATTDNSFFWLVNFYKSSSLTQLGQIDRNLVGSIYGRSPMEIAHSVLIR